MKSKQGKSKVARKDQSLRRPAFPADTLFGRGRSVCGGPGNAGRHFGPKWCALIPGRHFFTGSVGRECRPPLFAQSGGRHYERIRHSRGCNTRCTSAPLPTGPPRGGEVTVRPEVCLTSPPPGATVSVTYHGNSHRTRNDMHSRGAWPGTSQADAQERQKWLCECHKRS